MFGLIFIRLEYILHEHLKLFSSLTHMMAPARGKRWFKQCHIMIIENCSIIILETPDLLPITVQAQSERNYEFLLTDVFHQNKVLNSFSAVVKGNSIKSIEIIMCSTSESSAHRKYTLNIQYLLLTHFFFLCFS
jgi:hypothetical protein